MKKRFNVLGIGNAMVDILIKSTEEYLSKNDIKKGVMQLVNLKRSQALYSNFGSETEIPGGSGANTIYGLATLGISTSYIGKVKDDFLGNQFRSDLLNANIHYATQLSSKKNHSRNRKMRRIHHTRRRKVYEYVSRCYRTPK